MSTSTEGTSTESGTNTAAGATGEGTAAPKEKKPRGVGVGKFAVELITAGKSNAEVLAAVREKFPEQKTQLASINWYRNDLRKQKVPGVMSERELQASRKPAKAAEGEAKPAESKGVVTASPVETVAEGELPQADLDAADALS